jgi:peptidoglycan/LPS O-acetylase OafA/YrhL
VNLEQQAPSAAGGRISLAQRMADTGGRSTGFDYMRIILAVSIIVYHAFGVSYGLPYTFQIESTWIRGPVAAILPMFFALSGFLVAGSLERSGTMATFLGLRVLRIAPALAVEVTLSALILGPLLTAFPLSRYFTDPTFFIYFLNTMGIIHYALPGLFLSNPISGVVNGQLWTVPWELKCYIALTLLAVSTVVRRRALFAILTAAGCVALFALQGHHAAEAVNEPKHVPGGVLVLSFLAAVVCYNYRAELPWNRMLFAASAVVMMILLEVPGGDYFVAFPAAYATIYLGLLNPPKIALLRGADYSYGLYLYGYAIQQFVANLGTWTHHWYINLAFTLVIASAFAAMSWTLVEKPALKLKRYLPALERRFSTVSLLLARRPT